MRSSRPPRCAARFATLRWELSWWPSLRLALLVTVGLLAAASDPASAGDDARASSPRPVASWIEQLGSTDDAKVREAEEGLSASLKAVTERPRSDSMKDDFRTFRRALGETDGLRQRRLLGVLAGLVRGGSLDEYEDWWDRNDRLSVARSWARHGSAALDPLMVILRKGGNDIRSDLGETVALALAEVGDPAIVPLLEVLATAPSPIPAPDAPDHDSLVEAAIGTFGARSRAAYALARIPHARDRAIAPMIAHLLEDNPFDHLMPGFGGQTEADLDLAHPGLSFSAFAGMGAAAVPPLLATLARQRTPAHRMRVFAALRSLESFAAAAVPALTALVEDPKEDPRIRKAAVETLGWIRSESAVDTLVHALSSKTDGVAGAAHFALYVTGRPAVPALRRMLASKDPDDRRQAGTLLADFGAAAEDALPDLMKHWDDEGIGSWGTIRYASGEIAGSSGLVPADLVKRCMTSLGSGEPDVRSGALSALVRVASHAGAAAADVARLADSDPDTGVRTIAVLALAAIDSSRVKAAHLPLLVDELGQQMAHRRDGAARAIALLPSALAESLVALVLDVIGGWEDYTYFEALQTLADIGPRAHAAIPFLEGLADDSAAAPRRGIGLGPVLATAALWKIRSDGVERALKEIEASPGRRRSSIRDEYMLKALREMGPRAAKAVPVLLAALTGASGWDVGDIAETLGGIGTSPERVIPALLPLLGAREWSVRAGASAGLGGFGSAARAAVPRLIEALGDPAPDVRSAAADALGRIGLATPQAVAALAAALRDESEDVRREAAYSLGSFGAAAASAMPALESSRLDREVAVQRTAARSVLAIRSATAGERAALPPREPTIRRTRQDR